MCQVDWDWPLPAQAALNNLNGVLEGYLVSHTYIDGFPRFGQLQ